MHKHFIVQLEAVLEIAWHSLEGNRFVQMPSERWNLEPYPDHDFFADRTNRIEHILRFLIVLTGLKILTVIM